MLRVGLFASMLLLLPAATPSDELSPHAFQKLVDRTRGAILKVVSSPRGTAVLIGARGELLVDDRLAGKDGVAVEYQGERRQATLVAREPTLGLALLRLPPDVYPAAPAGSARKLLPGNALLGLAFDTRGTLQAKVGHFAGTREVRGLTRLRNDVAGPAGTALFNTQGQLVALHCGRPRATLPIDELRARFGTLRATE
ncbi:MAG: trypsin-like peptidase domain-containing protein [Deltaproteobacteria bacterium]|nr:trypsin-like peptidase domain-containing protein [Deltaproteobacteria bacterium]